MDLHPTVTKKDATTNTNDKCTEKCKTATHVLKSISDMRKEKELCDLVLEVGDTQFKVHRLVLCVWSPVVRALLLQPQVCCVAPLQVECQSLCHVHIGFSDAGVFEQFVNYLYTGDVPEEAINVPAVLLLAASFKVIQLQQYCEELLKATLNIENMISVHRLATKFSLKSLEVDCLNFLRKHAADIVQTNDFHKLQPDQINSFLGSESMLELDPEIKLFLIISWVTEEVANRQQFMVVLLSHIDWSVVAADFLLEIRQTDNFFTCNPSSLYLLLQTLHSSSISLGPYEDQFEDLKTEYSYLLASVVSSSVELGSTFTPNFQPVSVSLTFKNGGGNDSNKQKQSQQQGENQDKAIQKPGSLKSHPTHADTGHLSVVNQQHVEPSKNATNSYSECPDINFINSVESSDCTPEADDIDNSVESPSSISHCKDSVKKKKNLQTPKHSPANTQDLDKLKLRLNWPLTRSAKRKLDELKHESPKRTKSKQKTSKKQNYQKQKGSSKKSSHVNSNHSIQQTPTKATESRTSENAEKKESGYKTKKQKAKEDENQSNEAELTERPVNDSSVKELSFSQKQSVEEGKTKSAKIKENAAEDIPRPWLNDEGNFLLACDLCSFTSKSDLKYYRHMASSHFPGPPHHCDQQDCQFKAPCIKELTKHRTTHGDRRPFVCTKCLQAFRARPNLYAHLKVHFDVRPFECKECGSSFKHKSNLDQHMVIHRDLRPYLCDMCGFSTKFQTHLALHKKIHTGDVFHCKFPSCLYSTPKSTTFKAHMRSHLGIRTHVCSTCGKAFLERSHLVRHERIHSSNSFYSCSDCSYTSTRLDSLKFHQKKHHNSKAGKSGTQAKASSGAGGKGESPTKKKKSAQAGKSIVSERQSLPSTKERKQQQIQRAVPKEDIVEVVVMKANSRGKSHPKPKSNSISNMDDMQKTWSNPSNQLETTNMHTRDGEFTQSVPHTYHYSQPHIATDNQAPTVSLNPEDFFNVYDPPLNNLHFQINGQGPRRDLTNLGFPYTHNTVSSSSSHSQLQNVQMPPETFQGPHLADLLPDMILSSFPASPPPTQARDSHHPV